MDVEIAHDSNNARPAQCRGRRRRSKEEEEEEKEEEEGGRRRRKNKEEEEEGACHIFHVMSIYQ